MTTIVVSPTSTRYRTWVSENSGLGTWDDQRDWLWHHPTNYTADVDEAVAVQIEKCRFDIDQRITELLKFLEVKSAHIELPFNEVIGLKDFLEKTLIFNRDIKEVFAVAETKVNKDFNKNVEDKIFFAEHLAKDAEHTVLEALRVLDQCDRQIAWIRNYSENYTVAETKIEKDIDVYKSQSLNFYDAIKEVARGVISDLFFQEGIWTKESLDKFMRNGGRHVGYTTFREFITGDYEYQKALFRLALEATTADRALVEQIDVAIDVDDVYDRGSTSVTDKNYGATVHFSREFSIAPEVTVTMRGGNALEAIRPIVSNVSTTGFTVMLYDVEGNKTTGTFTWTAAGY